jgi:hypothetical protein
MVTNRLSYLSNETTSANCAKFGPHLSQYAQIKGKQ